MARAIASPQGGATTISWCPERLTRTVIQLALPAIGESLLTTLVLMANTILVGWLHHEVALAAVGRHIVAQPSVPVLGESTDVRRQWQMQRHAADDHRAESVATQDAIAMKGDSQS